ncbi:MAG: acyltransferase family protein [Erythrobacter sp.]
MNPSAAYRPDIEGLRAVAVIAVLLFHLGWGSVSGGFVGVDVFFVISGFLIGGIVMREAGEGRFSFGDYLMRRLKRIGPVMLVVLAVVTLSAALLLMPSELEGYATSLGFSALFMANVHFWMHRGAYAESEHEALLHMWTLGVEGQFYILLPLIVLGLTRFGRLGLWAGLVAIACVSAAASLLWPSASFYMLPGRLWEFLLGALVAVTPLPFIDRRWAREILALGGLALVLYAASAFHSDTPFPGWRAVIPCAGAAAIIAAGCGGPSLIGSALSLRPVRFVGKISYSLYLWHWPVIVLLLLGLPAAELGWELQAVAVALSFALATLSWRFVEEPCRRTSFPKRPLLWTSAGLTVALVVVALVLSLTSGWPQRFSPRGQQIAANMDYSLDSVFRSGSCFIHHRSQRFDEKECLVPGNGGPRVMLLGDSHAAHLSPGLEAEFPGSAISQVTAAGCRPTLGGPATGYRFCDGLMDRAFSEFLPELEADLIILAARWEEEDLPALAETLLALKREGYEALLVGPTAEWAQSLPRLLALAHERGRGAALPDSMMLEERAALDRRMAVLAAQTGTRYSSIHDIQCEPQCLYFGPSGAPVVVDNSHFTHEASGLFAGELEHPMLVRTAR